jgi:hypothetical protein
LGLSKQLLATSANRSHCITQQIASYFVVVNFKGAIGQALANFFDQLNVKLVACMGLNRGAGAGVGLRSHSCIADANAHRWL